MECARNSNVDSYTRYRTAAVAVVRDVHEQAGIETTALLIALAAFWGYVMFVVLSAVL